MSRVNELNEHVQFAEELFLLSEEVREMVNTLDVVNQRRYIIEAIMKTQEALDKVKTIYNVDNSELEVSIFDDMEF